LRARRNLPRLRDLDFRRHRLPTLLVLAILPLLEIV
jgi:hypothetical protein